MNIEIIDSIEKLLSYKTEWESIRKEMNSDNVFLKLGWIMLWWKHFGGRHKLFVLMVSNNQEVIGICPLMVTNKGICKEIGFIGGRQSGRMDFMLKDKFRDEALECISNYLGDLRGNNVIKLHGMSLKSENYSILKKSLEAKRTPFISSTKIFYFLNIKDNDFNTYFKNRFGNQSRKTMDKKEKKLKSLGNLVYRKISPAEIDEVFELHDKRWLRKIGNSSFSKGDTKEFYKELALNKNTKFRTTVDAITLNDKIISFIYGFEYNGKVSLLRIAHDDDFNFLSPGELVWKKKIEECFLSQIRVVDLGPGYEPYKAKWSDECEEAFTIVLPSDNLQSVLIFYIKYWVSIKLINALKKNKRIYNFSKYYLEKLKFLLSRALISNKILKIKKAVNQNGLLIYVVKQFINLISKIFSYKQYLILVKYLKNIEMFQSNLQVKEATIEDIDALSEVMNESASMIIRRFVNKHECYFVLYNSEIVFYCWINRSNIELSGKRLCIPFENRVVYVYDTFMKKEYRNKYNYMYIFSSIFNLLCNKNYKRCYITIYGDNNSFENEIIKKIFNPRYKIIERKLFGTIKHNIIDLS